MFALAYRLVLAASVLLLFACVWILIPAPNGYLLALGVGSPELSPILLAAGVVLALIASLHAQMLRVARLTLVIALSASVLALLPIAQLRSTLRHFDEAMDPIPLQRRPGMRPRAVVLADIFRPGDPGDTRVTRGIEFARPDGVPLTLDVYQPSVSGTFPVIVQIYGGSWQSGFPASHPWVARYLAARGHLVVAIDYRHAPEWRWPEQLEDVRSALRWVAEHAVEFRGDPSRIVLLGRSAGGHLAMRAAYQEAPSSIRGVVNYYGPTDLADGWRHPPRPDPANVRSILETFLGGTPDQMPDRYRHASPMTYASGKVPPTLHIYGARDHIVDARFGRMIDEALKKSGNTSVLLEIPWSEHAFDVLPTGLGGQVALYYMERFIAWALAE
jgi:acetyl esterase/lipase